MECREFCEHPLCTSGMCCCVGHDDESSDDGECIIVGECLNCEVSIQSEWDYRVLYSGNMICRPCSKLYDNGEIVLDGEPEMCGECVHRWT
jgi:hypothetical protein